MTLVGEQKQTAGGRGLLLQRCVVVGYIRTMVVDAEQASEPVPEHVGTIQKWYRPPNKKLGEILAQAGFLI